MQSILSLVVWLLLLTPIVIALLLWRIAKKHNSYKRLWFVIVGGFAGIGFSFLEMIIGIFVIHTIAFWWVGNADFGFLWLGLMMWVFASVILEFYIIKLISWLKNRKKGAI